MHSFATTCVHNNCTKFELPTIYQLLANSTIEVRTNDLAGDSWTRMYVRPIRTEVLANNNEQKTCAVRGNQWVNLYSHPDGCYLASVRGTSASSDLGNVTVTTFVDATNQMAMACDNVDHITAAMQRHWLIDATLNGQAEVRLPYKDQEFIQLDAASIVSINPDDRVYYPNQTSVKLSKYDGPNENNNVNDNCQGNAMMYESNNAVFNSSTYHYQDFIVPGFSEFWLHGSDYVTALPIVLKHFAVDCSDFGQTIEMHMMIENHTDFVRREFSENGITWNETYKNKVEPNPWHYQVFNFQYPNQREGYFRLSTIEKNGAVENHQIIHQRCDISNASATVYPNPASDQVMIQVNYPSSTMSNLAIRVVDVSGKEVSQYFVQVNGTNISVPISVDSYAKGTYLIHITDSENNSWIPKQLIVQ